MFNMPTSNLGVGINYRSDIAEDILEYRHKFDFIEINTERFFVEQNQNLHEIVNSMPVTLHGLTLSIGAVYPPISPAYLELLTRTLKYVPCRWFSEHIAMTHTQGIELRALMPVEFTEESVGRIANNAKIITALTPTPFLLENITYYYPLPNSPLTEIEFLNKVILAADCGLLLDVNNLYINSINHCYDPYDFINRLPLDRVVEVHLAGCDYREQMLVDTHASAIRQEVLSLFEYVARRADIKGVLIERDAKLNHFSELLAEVAIVRDIWK